MRKGHGGDRDQQGAKKSQVESAESQEENFDEALFCRVCDPIDEDLGEEAEEEAEIQRPLRDPGMPTKREIAEHNLSHLPPRPWCPHCVRGKGRDSPSLRVSGRFAEDLVPRIRLDYCFLTEGDCDVEPESKDDDDHTSAASPRGHPAEPLKSLAAGRPEPWPPSRQGTNAPSPSRLQKSPLPRNGAC